MDDEPADTLRTLRKFTLERRRRAANHAVALLDKNYLAGEIDRFIAQISEAQRDLEMLDRAIADEQR